MEDDLALLTGPGAEDLLAAAVGTLDEELLTWRVRSVDHRPGRSTTVAYDARVRGADGERAQVLGASTGLPTTVVTAGLLRLSDGELEVAVWRFPLDPGLPALAAATDESAVAALLASYDVEPGPLELRVRAYRPRRRAVVEVRTTSTRLFLKVLRPKVVEALHGRHRLLHEAGLPVPRSLGWSADGLLVLEALSGTTLRARLREGADPAPDGAAVLALLDRLPAEVCDLPHRRSWSDEVAHYAAVTGAALPSEADRCRQLAERVLAATADLPADEPVHGDLYESQLLLDGGRIRGLLDVDTPDRVGVRTTSPACSPTCTCWRRWSQGTARRPPRSAPAG